jgi:hypothetical protein
VNLSIGAYGAHYGQDFFVLEEMMAVLEAVERIIAPPQPPVFPLPKNPLKNIPYGRLIQNETREKANKKDEAFLKRKKKWLREY